MTEAVVVWWNKFGKEQMVVIVYAKDESDALRKGAGIFKFLMNGDRRFFDSAYNEAAVWWKDEDKERFQEYAALGRKTRSLYEKNRDQKRAIRTIEKIKKGLNPKPGFSPRRKLKKPINPAQGSLF